MTTAALSPSSTAAELQARAEEIAGEVLSPLSERVDRDGLWPEAQLRALGEAGLLGLHVPCRLGGREQGLYALALVTETLGRACPSTAMCYGMHCVATAVIASKATPFHEDSFLVPIAEGRHITTLSLSEPGTGSHFYLPQLQLLREGDAFVLNGSKSFVTNGSKADSYVISGQGVDPLAGAGEFSCLLLEKHTPGLSWRDPWNGFGMRGNSSCGMDLESARVPSRNLLGREGDQLWYVFEVVAPYFIMAMSGTYLGIAQACLNLALQHLRERRHDHTGEALADSPLLQHQAAELWIQVESVRQLVHEAARLGDLGDPRATLSLLASKAAVADMVTAVANEAMTLCGGIAYAENSQLARLLRDARAAHVMSPTTTLLKQWAGRLLLGLPIL